MNKNYDLILIDFIDSFDYNHTMIKISFSGYAGSGKTSLMNEVKKILSLKSKVETVDQLNGRNPFDSDKKSSFASQFFYMSSQINEENVRSMVPLDFLLCDQSVLDQWLYWRAQFMEKEITPRLEEKDQLLRNMFRFWIKTYDLTFIIRTDLNEYEKREFKNLLRKPDLDYIRKSDEILKSIIEEENLNVIETWNNNSIDECAHEIIRVISDYREQENSIKTTSDKF